jgi:hypothetical protein
MGLIGFGDGVWCLRRLDERADAPIGRRPDRIFDDARVTRLFAKIQAINESAVA